jgi:hypothetical protein
MVVAFGNKGFGIKALKTCLPHQITTTDIEQWGDEGFRQITVAAVGLREIVAHDGSKMWGVEEAPE